MGVRGAAPLGIPILHRRPLGVKPRIAKGDIPLDPKTEPNIDSLKLREGEIPPLALETVNQTHEQPVPILLLFTFCDEPCPVPHGVEEFADKDFILALDIFG